MIMNMNYDDIIKYTHLLLVIPLLLYVGVKGLNKEKINKYVYVVLIILAVEAFVVHSGLINIRNVREKFQDIVKGVLDPTIFSTGVINRRDQKWFEPKTHMVEIIDYEFRPQYINVMKGDTVKWTNKDPRSHVVQSYTDLFNSNKLEINESFEFTFNTQGVFNYFCPGHPYMRGSVTSVSAGHHPNVQDFDQKWNPYIHPLNQADAV